MATKIGKYMFTPSTNSGKYNISKITELNTDGTVKSTIPHPTLGSIELEQPVVARDNSQFVTQLISLEDIIRGTPRHTKTFKIDINGNLEITENKDILKQTLKQKTSAVSQAGIDYSVPESSDPDNNFLLELFDKNINNLVIDLKKHFGDTNEKVNEVVAAISTITSNIKNQITTNVNGLSVTADYDKNKSIERDATTGMYKSDLTHTDTDKLSDATFKRNIDSIKDLDVVSSYDAELEAVDVDLDTALGVERVQTRLKNCQGLEIVHLNSHQNLMKTSAFTLNLFEKYNYVFNVMLFLFKNLVDKAGSIEGVESDSQTTITRENGCATSNTIKLPKAIIKNIAQLVADQGTIQGTIDEISAGLEKTDMDTFMKHEADKIKTNLQAVDTPNNPSTPAFANLPTGPLATKIVPNTTP